MDSLTDGITAVVLAGGENTRFKGTDKAFVKIGGVPMVEHVVERLAGIFENILIVTNSPGSYSGFSNIRVVTDILKGFGPLGGIHAAMKAVKTPVIFVVSCDMPFIDTGIIREQAELFAGLRNNDVLIPRINSKAQPLHGIYRACLAERLGKYLSSCSDYSIRAFLKDIRVGYMDLPATVPVLKAFSNINSPRDFQDTLLK